MDLLDVRDELAERLEAESAAPEPAGVRKEGRSGDSCHGRGCIGSEAAAGSGDPRGNSRRAAVEQLDREDGKFQARERATPEVRPPAFQCKITARHKAVQTRIQHKGRFLLENQNQRCDKRAKTKDILLSIILTCFYPKSKFAQLFIKRFHHFIENSIQYMETYSTQLYAFFFRTDTFTIVSDGQGVEGGKKNQNKQNRKIKKIGHQNYAWLFE